MQSGLADYWAASLVDNNGLKPGQSVEDYQFTLSGQKWVPMKTVISAVHDYQDLSRRNGLDRLTLQKAQSWAAIQYIIRSPKMSVQIPAYLNALDAGSAPNKAFKQAFGLSSRAFGKRLKAYLQAPASTLPSAVLLSASRPAVNAQRLNLSESALAQADALRIFASSEAGLAAAYKHYGQSALSPTDREMGLAGLAEIAALRGDFDTAHSLMTEALGGGAQDPTLQRRAGQIYLSQFHQDGDRTWLQTAQPHMMAAREGLRNDPISNLHYGEICSQIECPGRGGAEAALAALSFFRDADHIRANFNVLPVLDERGEYDAILDFTAFARVWGETSIDRRRAQKIYAAVKRKKAKAVN
jgi:hypothetical protein